METPDWETIFRGFASPKKFLSHAWGDPLPIQEQFWLDLSSEKKQTLILLHGINTDHKTFLPATDFFTKKFRVIMPDLRAHGRSADRADLPTYATLAQDLSLLMDHLELEKVHVAGHSHGGRLAMKLAALRPDKIVSVIVEDMQLESMRPHHTLEDFLRNEATAEKFKQLRSYYASRTELTDHLFGLISREQALHYGASLSEEGPDGSLRLGNVYTHKRMDFLFKWEDLTEEMKVFGGRFLLLWADPARSKFCAQNSVEHMKRHLKSFELCSFPGRAHKLHSRVPEEYAKSVMDFLA